MSTRPLFAVLLGVSALVPEAAQACFAGGYEENERVGHIALSLATSILAASLWVRSNRGRTVVSPPVVGVALLLSVPLFSAISNYGICCDCGLGYRDMAFVVLLGSLLFLVYECLQYARFRRAT